MPIQQDPTSRDRRASLKAAVQHMFNPMHVYCRLVDLKIQRALALKIVHSYESLLWKRVFPF